MAAAFTFFPQLITKLRLEIWRLALPELLDKALYPYKPGCWVTEDIAGFMHMRCNPSLLAPFHIEIPLYFVNREAGDVASKYLKNQ
jgi:hypothetical protein